MATNADHTPESDSLFQAARAGDRAARDRLVALLYDDLRRAAARLMRRARPDHTLQPSALVHEALLKILGGDALRTAADRQMLIGATVQAMHQVLIDHHRRHAARKRAGAWQRHPLDAVIERLTQRQGIALTALNEALDRLARVEERACLVTTFHIFLEMSLPEIADALELSLSTVESDWRFARAWLRAQLKPDHPS